MIYHILFSFLLESSNIFLSPSTILNKSTTHKRYLIPLLYLFINCISAKSTLQILSLKLQYNFKVFNNGLWSSSANSLLFRPDPFVLSLKTYEP